MSASVKGALLLGAAITLIAPAAVYAEQGSATQTSPAQAGKPPANAPYRNASLPVEQRVADLLARMTLEEKVAQLMAVWDSKADIQDPVTTKFDAKRARMRYPNGIGHYSRPSDRQGPASPRVIKRRDAKESVEYVNALQTWAIGQTRLGIPVLNHEESLHGFAGKDATSFPQAIGMASSWDPDLIREINSVIAREVRARGSHLVLSPVVDVARDPRWGRIEETFGEDHYLAAEMGVAAVEGLQGVGKPDVLPEGKVFATLKHMTGHGQPEGGRNTGPAPIGERTLREDFFPPFEAVVKRTGIQAVMPSYNEIDGLPSHSNKWLLDGVLRGEWGFKGALVSDYYAIEQMGSQHAMVAGNDDAAKRALAAGVDSDLPNGGAFAGLTQLVRKGEVDAAAVDKAVSRILAIKFRAGLFENPFAKLSDTRITNNAEAIALARKAAVKSMVLLKNDGTLPLADPATSARKPRIAVIGPNAAVARLGGYYGEPPATVTPLDGIKAAVGAKADIIYSEGVSLTENDDWWADEVKLADPAENRRKIAAAEEAAKDADTIVLFIGDTEQTSREGWADSHLGDRSSLDLVGQQQDLFDALKATGKPVVAVLVNGRPPSYVKVAEQANAVLETWYGGEQQGNAIADVLFGKESPGGKMPVTVARHAGQLPLYYNYKPSGRRGYLFDTTEPLYPFGFGLSYTNFELSAPHLSKGSIRAGETIDVTVEVTNTGHRTGDEVVQVYVRDMVASVTRPVRQLQAFRRVTLKPGERRNVTLQLGPEAFQLWNADMKRVIEPGEFEIMAGPNSAQTKSVTLTVVE